MKTVVALVVWMAAMTLAVSRYAPPPARGPEAPVAAFSSERAIHALAGVLGDGAPHPSGTAANARVRSRIVDTLRDLGITPSLQAGFACGRHGACGFVENVLAVIDGPRADDGLVLAAAHLDCVPAASGAIDDGTGVAVLLEIARALRADPPRGRSVLLLFTDGEEDGLLGAELFAREHASFAQVKATVNLDARGSGGPTMLFQTGNASAAVIALARRHLTHPVTSSLFSTIYERMPNDTDFTVLGRLALGANLALIRSIEHYHTPLDRLDHVDARSLQHHGDNALAFVRAFSEAQVPREQARAAWFDVAAAFVVAWPEGWTFAFAALAFALVVLRCARARIWMRCAIHAAVLVAAVMIAAIAFETVAAMLRVPAPWTANAMVIIAAACTLAVGVVAFLALRLPSAGAWEGTWLLWSVLGLATSFIAPGAAFVFVVPALVAAATGPRAAVAGALAAILPWAPVAALLPDTVGLIRPAVVAGAAAFVLSALWPLLVANRSTRWIARGAGAVTAVATALAAATPWFSERIPQRVNVLVHQDSEAQRARVFVEPSWGPVRWGEVPEPMERAMTAVAPAQRERSFPWSTGTAPASPVALLSVPAPEVTVQTDERNGELRTVTARVRSLRNARVLGLYVPPEPAVVITRAHDLPVRPRETSAGWTSLLLTGVPADGVDVTFQVRGSAPVEIVVTDATSGVPESAAGVILARPSWARATQSGDETIVSRRVRF